jgi:hypothetical protein
MKPELTYLVWVTSLTAVMWIPYILERIMAWGAGHCGLPAQPQSPISPGSANESRARERG